MSADAGQDGRDMLALVAVVKDVSARLVMAEARLDAFENPEAGPSPEVDRDQYRLSGAERDAMRERLRAGTLEGIEANKTDPNRVGRTYRRESTAKIGL